MGSDYFLAHVPTLSLENLNFISKPSIKYKTIEIDFIGFNKPEYYTKEDRIEKERWVGMTLFQVLSSDGSVLANSVHENYFFINGNIHPIYSIDISLPLTNENLQNG